MFNFECMSSWEQQGVYDCAVDGQRRAPLATANVRDACQLGENFTGIEDVPDLTCYPVVLQGYDVIAYYSNASIISTGIINSSTNVTGSALCSNSSFTSVMGLPDYSYRLESADSQGDLRVYEFWFQSYENQQLFASDPWRYAPRFGGFGAWGVCCETESSGYSWTAVDMGPASWPACSYTVYKESLYLSFDDELKSAFFSDPAYLEMGEECVYIPVFSRAYDVLIWYFIQLSSFNLCIY